MLEAAKKRNEAHEPVFVLSQGSSVEIPQPRLLTFFPFLNLFTQG
jgi:hypothetical protein